MASQSYSVNLNINANASAAKAQLQDLQRQLQQISNMNINIGTGNLTADIEKASQAAMKLSAHLAAATNPQTGNLDFTKFYTSIQKSGASLEDYGKTLQSMGPAGQKAFVSLAGSIAKAEVPLKRTNKLVDGMWDNLKKTVGWQLSSSMIHGFIGGVQQAVGYAKDLNRSLNDIRIVTGASSDQMAKFAKEANLAAKSLSTTTTDYTKASLIYYQQGLSDQEVKARTETTIKMANVTRQSAQTVSDQMTAIWNNYDNGTKSLTHYADVMTALGAATASSTDEIATGLQKFASISETVGLSYEYAASALATVTATSRESADVVGNSFKTLFSRIQGLQLGETLDDGTTLNKYSTALSKVGISIKDSSGEMKNMDDILDEMGSKWQTLANDEKMALAQTVAGVRQYTQLMTLMENWDYFKQNLNVANFSGGTLDAQAAIYAESWEAASKRVRSSWEGLWDSLINSDSMITILDGLSGIVKLMDKMTTSIGGAGGVLTSFLGIATKAFAPRITQGLRDTMYNIGMAFGGEKKMLAARESFLTNAINKVDVNGEFGDLYGSSEAQARKDSMISQMRSSLMYADNSRNMTPLQHQLEQQYAQMTQIQDQRVIDAAANLDAAKNARYDAWADLMYRGKGGDEEGILERSRRDVAQIGQDNLKARKGDMTRNDYLAAQQRAGQFVSQAKADTLFGSKPIKEVLDPFSNSLNNFYKTMSSPDALKSQQSVDKLTGLLNDLNQTGYQSKGYDKIISQMQQKIQGAYSQGITSIDLSKEFSKLFSLQGQAAGGIEFGQLIESYLKQNFEVGKNEATLTDEERRARSLRAGRQANLDEKQNIDWATALVTGGQGAMMALSAGQSIQALTEQLSNGTVDAVTSLSSITSAIFSFGMGLNSFKTLLSGLNVAAAGPWALGITALITALPLLFNLFDQIHVSEKEKLQQEAETQNSLQNAVTQSKNYHESLNKTVDTYENNQEALTKLTRGTNEWTSSLYSANQAASKLISENNLVEGEDYFRNSFGALEIKDEVLNNLTNASEEAVEKASNIKDLSSISKTTRADEKKYEENLDEIENDLQNRLFSRNDEYRQVNDDIINLQAKAGMIEQSEYDAQLNELIERQNALYDNYGPEKMLESIADIDYDSVIKEAIDILSKDKNAFSDVSAVQSKLGLENDLMMAEEIYKITDKLLLAVDQQNTNNAIANENYENLARNFLSDEVYTNDENVLSASGRILRNLSEDKKATSEKEYNQNYKSIAQEYADMIGLGVDENFKILNKTISGDVKYQYTDSNGKIAQDTFSKNTLIEFDAASKSLDQLIIATQSLDTVFNDLNKTSQDADGALQSYIAEQNMGKATLQQMNALAGQLDGKTELIDKQSAIEKATGLSVANQEKIAELEGVSIEDWIDGLIRNLTETISDTVPHLDRVKTRLGAQMGEDEKGNIKWNWQEGQDNLSNLIDGLNVENLKLLDSTLTNVQALSGETGLSSYVDALTNLANSAGDVDSNSLIQMLLTLENTGSAAGNLQAIQAIIEGLGGSFEGATAAAQAFAAALAGINAPGLDGILSKLNQIKNVLGDVFSLETGSNIGEDAYNNIIKALPGLEGLFTEDIINGGYRYTGSQETARGAAKNAYFESGNDIAKMQEWSKDTLDGWNNANNEKWSMSKWGEKITGEFSRDNIEATQAGSQNETISTTGNSLQMFTLLANGLLGQGALDAVIAQQEGINSAGDIAQVLSAYQTNMQLMTDLMSNVTETNGDGVTDYRDIQDAGKQKQYLEAQNAATAAQAILSNIWSLIEQLADPEGLANAARDFESTKGQLAEDTDQLADMYKVNRWIQENGDTSFRDINGKSLSEGSEVIKNYASNLALMGQQYDYSRESAIALSEAISNGNSVLVESLMQQTELETAIAQTAEARGLDADALASQIERMEEKGYFDDDANGDGEKNYGKGLSAKDKAQMAADIIAEANALRELNEQWSQLSANMNGKEFGKADESLNKIGDLLADLTRNTRLAKMSTLDLQKGYQNFIKEGGNMSKVLAGNREEITKLARFMTKADWESNWKDMFPENDLKASGKSINNWKDAVEGMATAAQKLQEQTEGIDEGLITTDDYTGSGGEAAAQEWLNGLKQTWLDAYNIAYEGCGNMEQAMATATANTGIEAHIIPSDTSGAADAPAEPTTMYGVRCVHGCHGSWTYEVVETQVPGAAPVEPPSVNNIELTKLGDAPKSGGGGGGGGGGKEPKKVANKRKSQTVKRYKKNDYKRKLAEKVVDSAENKKDYLYGESKIAQMQKINRLAEKEAKITADRIKESRKYLVEDRENLIKYMQKYGFEAEFDADGFLANYEQAWTAIYEEIAALYEDNLLTEEEEKIEEDLNIKLEELEGALEDYENSLEELADDIEKWEETLYEMFDNKIEQMEHKVEFKLELDEDSLTYIDFLIENLGDSAVRAIDKIDLIAEKTGYLFNSIQTAYEGVEEIYALSDDPLHLFATGGADIDGLLTESQVEALRGQADSLQDFADQLRDIRDTIQEQVAEVFDMWTEKVNHNISTLEHYGSIMEYFKGIIDLTGNDIFGLSDEFVRAMESAQINQSIDQMEANKAYYEELQEMRTNVEAELYKAQASGDAERIAYWEEHLRTVEEEMQTAQDSMLAALESTLSMITDQFTAAMEDAVDTFGKSLYASGGLEGLSNDYSLMREQADLMAEDYDKIYNLSKLTRNINKTLDDTNIIAGKQRLNKLLQEVNSLQADNVELSKFDLEYLQAKYELYLAEVELRNAQANKDTVTLTKDSEGNYSYVYTVNENKVDEAQQKYEDALYEMQNMNHEYIEEMSAGVVETMQAMNDEIASLEISDFANLEEYNARVQEIREKYFAQLELQESELNKAIGNNQELYETDWKAYSEMTGYKISADKEWINSFRETTLGYLTESQSLFSDFSQTASTYADTLVESLSTAATGYFAQIEEALAAYDTSIANFGSHITGTYKDIQDSSDKTKDKTIEMAKAMKEAFEEVVNTVGNWQDTDGLEITEMLDKIATYLKEIFDAINTSANIKTDSGGNTIGQQEATRLLSSGFEYNGETYSFGSWTFNSRGDLNINDGNGFNKDGSNLVDYHAYLAEQVQDALDAYYSNPDDATLKATAENLIKRYWAYRSIIDRVYDPGEIESNVPKSFDTGGYTGEWGSEGRLAMLHQKEIVLNADDTANFLEALNISRQLIEMIEMNARASSLGLGEMVASTIKDNSQTIEQQVYITAEFPEATNHSEIEEAFDNIINLASQYAFRRD